MLDGLDDIPWRQLKHAYGSAEDVPGLIRALATASPDLEGPESPLFLLYGNICHQGSIDEATAYAVPFLLELAADKKTPDRVGILQLLGTIAESSSYQFDRGRESDVKEENVAGSARVDPAQEAIEAGFNSLVSMVREGGDVGMTAAFVLANLPARRMDVARLLLELLNKEDRSLHRAGFLLLMGDCGARNAEVLAALDDAVRSSDELQRRAAARSIARMKIQPLSEPARRAIQDGLLEDDLNDPFLGLPWYDGYDYEQLREALEEPAQEEVAQRLIEKLEEGQANHGVVNQLLELLFERGSHRQPPLRAADLSPLQARAVRALARAVESSNRIYLGRWSQWGLPETKRDWRELANGRDPAPVDPGRPKFAYPDDPQKRMRFDQVEVGDRVLHRQFGLGTITEFRSAEGFISMKVKFDEEGTRPFAFEDTDV